MGFSKIKKIDELIESLEINDLTDYIDESLLNKKSYQEILDYCNTTMLEEVENKVIKNA